jgi:hypothetical protein
MRPDRVVVLAPSLDQHLRLAQAVEDLTIEQLVPELTSLTPSALTTSATLLPWPSSTSASRSLAMISSARKPLRGMPLSLLDPGPSPTSAWTDSAGEGHARVPCDGELGRYGAKSIRRRHRRPTLAEISQRAGGICERYEEVERKPGAIRHHGRVGHGLQHIAPLTEL